LRFRLHADMACKRLDARVFQREQLAADHERGLDGVRMSFILGPADAVPRGSRSLFEAADDGFADFSFVERQHACCIGANGDGKMTVCRSRSRFASTPADVLDRAPTASRGASVSSFLVAIFGRCVKASGGAD